MDKSQGWGRIMVGARLEKMVEAGWVRSWTKLIATGLRDGDMWELTEGMVAHMASNRLAALFLKSPCDSLLIVDSDADFESDMVEKFRTHEPGFEYDALQAFHLRRGWPPEAIWFKRDQAGILHNCVLFGETTEDVALVGTHCVIIRREVFEKMLGDSDPEKHDWFYYPRHEHMTEDAAFSFDALEAGLRLGATTAIKVNHLAHLSIGWKAYQEFIQTSGQGEQITRFDELSAKIAAFTGETQEQIVAKMAKGAENVSRAWNATPPKTPEQVRAFYGSANNQYLYDLLNWDCSMYYISLTRPLENYHRRKALVIGAGLGTEAALLANDNKVEVFELPGVLRDFCKTRLDGTVGYLEGDKLTEALPGRKYDLVVAIDTIEHIHPDEFAPTMQAIADAIEPGGELYAHNNFEMQETYPMHFDHSAAFKGWAADNQFTQVSEFVWKKKE